MNLALAEPSPSRWQAVLTCCGIALIAGCASVTDLTSNGRLVWTPPLTAPPHSDPTPLTLSTLHIPAEHGKIKEIWNAGVAGPIVLHIEDANAQYVAQKHEAAILDDLICRHGLYLVLVEGGSRNDSLSYMRTQAPMAKRRQIAEQFLRAGKISGENYLDLTTDHQFLVYGVEKPELYDAQIAIHQRLQQTLPKAQEALRGFRSAVDRLKEKFYSSQFKEFERWEAGAVGNVVGQQQFWKVILADAEKAGIQIKSRYPTFMRFVELDQVKHLDDEQDRYTDLHMQEYLAEETSLIDALKVFHAQTVEAKQLLRLARDVQILEDLVGLKLTPENYQALAPRKAELAPRMLANNMETLSRTVSGPGLLDVESLDAVLPDAIGYYDTTVQRARAMVDNTLKRVEDAHVPFAVLIAGGFHTPTLTQAFKEHHVSYAVIAPTVGPITAAGTALYHKVLKETYVPMSEEAQQRASGQSTTQTTH